jgi:hypothetical protein
MLYNITYISHYISKISIRNLLLVLDRERWLDDLEHIGTDVENYADGRTAKYCTNFSSQDSPICFLF